MTDRIEKFGLQVARPLFDMIEREALPAAGVASDTFWKGLADLLHGLGPKNRALLAKRDDLQAQVDAWHRAHRGMPIDAAAYKAFLAGIGYLVPEGPDFTITTANVDPEIASMPGPQLVVPVMNARYALNAANARWGSLYDALYGTDALGELPPAGGYSEERGARVIAWAKKFLDQVAPLVAGSHADVTAYRVADGKLQVATGTGLTALADPSLFAGYQNLHLLPLFRNRIAYGSKGFPWTSPYCSRDVQYGRGTCPVAEDLHSRRFIGVNVCMHELRPADVELVVRAFRKVWSHLDDLR